MYILSILGMPSLDLGQGLGIQVVVKKIMVAPFMGTLPCPRAFL